VICTGTGGAAAAVDLASFSATPFRDRVRIRWSTSFEIDNAGFHIHRAASAEGERRKVTDEMIVAGGDEVKGAAYSYTDTDVQSGMTYYYWLEDVDLCGKSTLHGPVSARVGSITPRPLMLSLSQNEPNPFRAYTEIRYALPVSCDVRLAIYNLQGQQVRTLVAGYEDAGERVVRWDGRDDDGAQVAGGVYICRIEAAGQVAMRKLVFLD
jgi:hypothetical protein